MFFLFRSYDKFGWLLYKENHFSLYYPDHKFGFLLIALQGKLFQYKYNTLLILANIKSYFLTIYIKIITRIRKNQALNRFPMKPFGQTE